MSKSNRYPRSMLFSLTNLCNANCMFCYRRDVNLEPPFFPFERFRELMQESLPFLQTVRLSGLGEPTLHPEFFRFAEFVRSRSSPNETSLILTTNGSRLLGDINTHLVDQGFAEVWISLNAATAATHAAVMPGISFERVIAGVRALVFRRNACGSPIPKIRLSFVATKDNYFEAEAFVELGLNMGVDIVTVGALDKRLNPAIYQEQSVKENDFTCIYERIASRADEDCRIKLIPKECLWPSDSLDLCEFDQCRICCENVENELGVFFTDGRAAFCCYMAAHIEDDRYCIGNVYEQSVEDVWNSPLARRFRRSLRDSRRSPAICVLCTNSWGKRWLPRSTITDRIMRICARVVSSVKKGADEGSI